MVDPNATYVVLNGTINQLSPLVLNATLNQSSQILWKDWLPPIAIIIAAIISAAIAAWTWKKNEESKRVFEDYKRKEKMYTGLINSLRGFYKQPETGSADPEKVGEFIKQLSLCWMYCPDDVIKNAYDFIDSVYAGRSKKSEEKEEAYGRVMLSIRKDLINRNPMKETNFSPSDFRHIKPELPNTQTNGPLDNGETSSEP
jgi:hypothetical protein